MRFVIEHLPRVAATYLAVPVTAGEARRWMTTDPVISLVRTTEMIGAVQAGLEVALQQADRPVALESGDEALYLSLSFSVLLAWAQGEIVPMDDDWRCLVLRVQDSGSPADAAAATAAVSEPAADADLQTSS